MTPTKSIPVVGLILIALLSGCAAAPQVKTRMDFHSPAAVLAHLDNGIPTGVVVQTLADIRMTTKDGVYPMKLAVLLQKPASLRVEAIPLLGPPAFFLSLHEQILKVFFTETRAFHVGRATSDNIARYLPLKMDPQELTTALTGTGLPLHRPEAILLGRTEGDRYRIDRDEAGRRESLWVRLSDGFLERLDVHQDQILLYQIRYEEPLRVEQWMLPQKLTIVFEGRDGVSLRIRYRNIRFLKQTDTALFDLAPPPGVAPVFLD
jgi:hypothetical protein